LTNADQTSVFVYFFHSYHSYNDFTFFVALLLLKCERWTAFVCEITKDISFEIEPSAVTSSFSLVRNIALFSSQLADEVADEASAEFLYPNFFSTSSD